MSTSPFFPPERPAEAKPDPGRLGRHPLGTSPLLGLFNAGPQPINAGEPVAPAGPAYHGDRGPTPGLSMDRPLDSQLTGQSRAIPNVRATREKEFDIKLPADAPQFATPDQGADPEWTSGHLYQVLLAEERGENRDVWLFLSDTMEGFPGFVGPIPVGVMRRAFGHMRTDQPPFIAVKHPRYGIVPVVVGPPIFVPGNPINLMRKAFACIADGCKAANPDTGFWLGAMTQSLHAAVAPRGVRYAPPKGQSATVVSADDPARPVPVGVAGSHHDDDDDRDPDDSSIDSDLEMPGQEAAAPAVEVGGPVKAQGGDSNKPTEVFTSTAAGDILRAMAGFPDTAHVHLLHSPGSDRQQGQCMQTVGSLRLQIGAYPDRHPVYFPSAEPGYAHAVCLEDRAPQEFVDKYLAACGLRRKPNEFWLLARPSKAPA